MGRLIPRPWLILGIVLLVAGIVVFVVLLGMLIASRFRVAGPNQAFLITGRKGKGAVRNPETGEVSTDLSGQKVIMGASTFVLPVVQKLHVMDLSSRRISVGIRGAVSSAGIKCDLEGVAIVKVGGNEDAIRAAAQRVGEAVVRTPTLMAFAVAARRLVAAALPGAPQPRAVEDALRTALLELTGDGAVVILGRDPGNVDRWELEQLSRMTGWPLVGIDDLAERDGRVVLRGDGSRVDVVWRRTREERLRGDDGRLTALGSVLLEPLRSGAVRVLNAFGTGVADDKRTYVYVDRLVRFYCGAEPLLRAVPAWDLADDEQRAEALARLDELVFKPRDGAGGVIGSATADWRNSAGWVLSGPEFLTVFNGSTGKAVATTDYVPPRGSVAGWGDRYGNRVDRFLAAVAYLDGEAVGWVGVAVRTDTPRLVNSRTIPSVDDLPVWSIGCFRVRPGFRRRGVARALLKAVVVAARDARAPAVEAYPIDPEGRRVEVGAGFVGIASMFDAAGF
ncbi:MAG: GNAT family N-acetyltransferase, partial [Actinobacteria bacterium]|nr:GNAT family N-acetyltransferase [Actinomycetota bacterium]